MSGKAPRLDALAKAINEKVPGVAAAIEKGFCNTDRKIAGTRLRSPGKGRTGNRLKVYDTQQKVIIDHNSAETYRTNDEAASEVEKLWGRIWEPDVYPSLKRQRVLRERLVEMGFTQDTDFSFSQNHGYEGDNYNYLSVKLRADCFTLEGNMNGERVHKTLKYSSKGVEELAMVLTPKEVDVQVSLTAREYRTIKRNVEGMWQTAIRMAESHKHDPFWVGEEEVCLKLMEKFGEKSR